MHLSFRLRQTPLTVFEHLSNMQKLSSVHPVISRIDHTSLNNYRVYETLRLGFLPFSFTYPVTVEKDDAAKTVMIRARVVKWIVVKMSFTIKADQGETVVEEDLHFNAVYPIKWIMQAVFKKQHGRLFENINKLQNA